MVKKANRRIGKAADYHFEVRIPEQKWHMYSDEEWSLFQYAMKTQLERLSDDREMKFTFAVVVSEDISGAEWTCGKRVNEYDVKCAVARAYLVV